METQVQQPPLKKTASLHVRENSKDELDALFDINKLSNVRPLNQRKLPDSFFRPPENKHTPSSSTTHSRQNSCDTSSLSQQQQGPPYPTPIQLKALATNNQNLHSRSSSEPAVISQFSLPKENADLITSFNSSHHHNHHSNHAFNTHHPHLYQRNLSVNCGGELPLPHGWEMAKSSTGQRYYINHITQEKSWQDPRTFSLNNENVENLLNNMPLPNGWQKAQTENGETYFINHINQITQWEDPRLPMLPNIIKQMQQQQQQQQQQQNHQSQHSFQGQFQSPSNTFPLSPSSSSSSTASLQQASVTVNTPSTPTNQLVSNQSSSNLSTQNPNLPTTKSQTAAFLLNNDRSHLQKLLIDIIKKKNELLSQLHEISQQESYLKAQLQSIELNNVEQINHQQQQQQVAAQHQQFDYLSSSSSSASPLNQIQQQQQQTTNTNNNQTQLAQQQQQQQQTQVQAQHHMRQNSADSGLGGISYVNNIDVDSVNDLCKLNINKQNQAAHHASLIQQQISFTHNQSDVNQIDTDSIDDSLKDDIEYMCQSQSWI